MMSPFSSLKIQQFTDSAINHYHDFGKRCWWEDGAGGCGRVG